MRATAFAPDDPRSGPPTRGVSLAWKLVCVAITGLALFLVFRKVPVRTLFDTLRTMRVGWFVAAVALYGLMFLPAAWRWHLSLRINESLVNYPASVRFSVIGHFFYLTLFGGTVGDAAKAAVYGRRYGLPLTRLMASVWLDRLMGSGALIVVAGAAFLIADLPGGVGTTKLVTVRHSAWWLLLLIPLIILGLWGLKRSRHESVLRRLGMSFLEGGQRLLKSPGTVLTGFVCSLLMQIAANFSLALTLQAVSHAPLPWVHLVWTFPLITTVSGLPVTVAGIGARDGAAIALLGWCGVAAVDAEAMAMLTLCVTAVWGVVGATILWIESNKRAEKAPVSQSLP